MLSISRASLRLTVALAATVAATEAHAEDAEPSYGRVDGDVTVVVGVGASVASGGPRAAADLRARYLESAGLFATYEDGTLVGQEDDPRRLLALGLELRPLFLYRWLEGHETRRARLDLALDSFGLEVGVVWSESLHRDGFASYPGIEAGLGVEVPITAEATGLWLAFHGGLRWTDDALIAGPIRPNDREAYVTVTLAWHQLVSTHLVDLGDQAPRWPAPPRGESPPVSISRYLSRYLSRRSSASTRLASAQLLA